jgi:hypothetical protein
VLRSGGEYKPEHVERLRRQMFKTTPSLRLDCLTDLDGVPRSYPLEHGWPGWWSKLEICRPGFVGPLLYIDLDTTVVRDMAPLVRHTTHSIVLRDYFRNGSAVQSSFMLLTEADRRTVWQHFIREPDALMERYRRGGDQLVFERLLGKRALRWQDRYPGQVVGYKSELRKGRRVPGPGTRVIIYHGRPRPWDVEPDGHAHVRDS